MFRQKEFGISLVELIVAMAVLGGLGLVVTQLGQTGGNVKRSAQANLDKVELTNQLRSVFNSQEMCDMQVAGAEFQSALAGAKIDARADSVEQGTNLTVYHAAKDASGALSRGEARFDSGQSFGALRIADIKLKLANVSQGDYFGSDGEENFVIANVEAKLKEKNSGKDYVARVSIPIEVKRAGRDLIVQRCARAKSETEQVSRFRGEIVQGYRDFSGDREQCNLHLKLVFPNGEDCYKKKWIAIGDAGNDREINWNTCYSRVNNKLNNEQKKSPPFNCKWLKDTFILGVKRQSKRIFSGIYISVPL